MGSTISCTRKDTVRPELPLVTPTSSRAAHSFVNIFSQKEEATSITGSIYASYVPSPILCLRTFHSLNPSLELIDSLLYRVNRSTLLVIKIKFKYFSSHKKNVPLYFQTLNGFISSVVDYITLKWGGFIWKIEDSERIYCLFGDLSLSEDTEAMEDFANEKSTISVRNAVLCAYEICQEYNGYVDDNLGVQFSLHFLVTHGKEVFFMHSGGLQDKWIPILLLEQQQNSLIHFLLPNSRRGQILISSAAYGYIKNDGITLTEEQCNDPKYRDRLLYEQQIEHKNYRHAEKVSSSLQHSWADKHDILHSLGKESPDFRRQSNLPILRQDDLDSVFDSEEEKDFLERQNSTMNLSQEKSSHISRFICRPKHDSWILQDAYYEYFDLKSDIYSQGYMPYLRTQFQFSDKSTYQGYLSDQHIAIIESNHLRSPQQIYASILTISLPFSRIQESDIQNLQRNVTLIQRTVAQFNGVIHDIILDPHYRIVVTCLFGLPYLGSSNDTIKSDISTHAVQSALAIFSNLETFGEKNVLTGIATGFVYLWTIGSIMRKTFTLLGDTVALSKDLLRSIQAHGILVDHTTFVNSNHSVSYYESMKVVRRKDSEIFVHTPSVLGFSRMISREHEVNEISSNLESMLEGTSSTKSIVLKSEFGPGKSIMLKKIISKLRSKNRHVMIVEGCNLTNIPFYPFFSLFKKLFGIPANNITPYPSHISTQLQKIYPSLGYKFIFNYILPVSFPVESKLQGEELRRYMIHVFSEVIRYYTKQQPTIMIIHRAHLLDSISMDLIGNIRHILPNVYFLETTDSWDALMTYRSHVYNSLEIDETGYLNIKSTPKIKIWDMLSDFDQENTKKLLCSLLKCRDCVEDIVSFVHASANGNPIYINDITLLMQSLELVKVDNYFVATFAKNVSIDSLNNLPRSHLEIMLKRYSLLGEMRRKLLQYLSVSPSPLSIKALSLLPQVQFFLNQLPNALKELENYRFIKTIWANSHEYVYTLDNETLRQTILQNIAPVDRLNIHKAFSRVYIENEKLNLYIVSELHSQISYHIYSAMKDGLDDANLLFQGINHLTKLGNIFIKISAIEDGLEVFEKANEMLERIKMIKHAGIRQGFDFTSISEYSVEVSRGIYQCRFLISPTASDGRKHAKLVLEQSVSKQYRYVEAAIALCCSYIASKELEPARDYIHIAREAAASVRDVELSLLAGASMSLYQFATGKLAQAIDTSKYVMQLYQRDQHSFLYASFPLQTDLFTFCVSIGGLASVLTGNFERAVSLFNQVTQSYTTISPSLEVPFTFLCISMCIIPTNLQKVEIWINQFQNKRRMHPMDLTHVITFLKLYIESTKGDNEREKSMSEMKNTIFKIMEEESLKSTFIFPLVATIYLNECKEQKVTQETLEILNAAKDVVSKYSFLTPGVKILEAQIKERIYKSISTSQYAVISLVTQTMLHRAINEADSHGEYYYSLQALQLLYRQKVAERMSAQINPENIQENITTSKKKFIENEAMLNEILKEIHPLKEKQRELENSKKESLKNLHMLNNILERQQKCVLSIQNSIEETRKHPSNLTVGQSILVLKELSREERHFFTIQNRFPDSISYLAQAFSLLMQNHLQSNSQNNQPGTSPQRVREKSWEILKAEITSEFLSISNFNTLSITSQMIEKVSNMLQKIQIEDIRRVGNVAIALFNWISAILDVARKENEALSLLQDAEKESAKCDSIVRQISSIRVELTEVNSKLDAIKESLQEKQTVLDRYTRIRNEIQALIDYYTDWEEAEKIDSPMATVEEIKNQMKVLLNNIDSSSTSIRLVEEVKQIVMQF